ncbi:13172_t:CDS:2 [Entrophospora sp. SA101]|nr:13172_t:CDS:2 [Entrophospora sp. SA101]
MLPPVTVPTFLQPVIQSWVAWLSFTFIAIPVSTFFLIWDFPKSIWRLLFSDYPKVVLITGANSGIGAELALAYARPNTTIGLIAHRLNNVATACKKKGATIRVMSCDITNLEDLNRNIDEFDEANPIELLIANAAQIGITTDQELSDQWEDLWHRYFEVNVVGTLATVMTTYKKMRDRGKGQIAITSSIGGHFSMPQMIFYNSTKAALISFARDLRYLAARSNIKINLITPGLIDTSDPRQPVQLPRIFKSSPRSLAKIIQWQLLENRFEITWPFVEYLPAYATSILPPRVLELATYIFGVVTGFITGTGNVAWT